MRLRLWLVADPDEYHVPVDPMDGLICDGCQ